MSISREISVELVRAPVFEAENMESKLLQKARNEWVGGS